MSDLRKMAQDAGFNTEFDDYVIDHWKRFEKFAELIAADTLAQPEQEPVAWLSIDSIGERYLCFSKPNDNDEVHALYTAPPQRKPLTEDEIDGIAINYDGLPNSFLELARAIEKAHGIGGEA